MDAPSTCELFVCNVTTEHVLLVKAPQKSSEIDHVLFQQVFSALAEVWRDKCKSQGEMG